MARAEATHVDLQLSARHDDNVSRAEAQRDIASDSALDLGLTATRSLMLSPNSGMLLKGELRLVEQREYSELSHVSAKAGASYRIQPIIGYTAPLIELNASVERVIFRDSDIRDGTLFAADVAVGKRFTDRIRGRIGLGWEHRWADDQEVFEWDRRRVFAAADYRLSPDITLYGNLARDFGDQVFTATSAPDFLLVAKTIADDPVFGERRAYRLGAIADTLEIGLSTALNSANTLDLGLRHFRAEADGGHSYDGTELRASWLYRFR